MNDERFESDIRFQLLTRAIGEAVWDRDLLTGETWRSDGFTKLFGYPPEEIGTSVDWWFEKVHPEDRPRMEAPARAPAAGGETVGPFEYRFRRVDGTYADVLGRGFVMHDSEGRPIRLIGALMDITERKQAEAEHARLLESERIARASAETTLLRLRAIQSVTDAALAHLAPDDLMREMLARICAILSTDTATVLLISEDGGHLSLHACRGLDPGELAPQQIPVGEGIAGAIAATREPIVVEDLSTAGVYWPALREKLSSLMGVPLIVEGEVVGVLQVGTRLRRRFHGEDVRLLQLVADRVAPAIDRARLFEEVRGGRERLQALSRQLVELQEAERRRIARELHDDVGQLLTGLKLMLETGREGPATRARKRKPGKGAERSGSDPRAGRSRARPSSQAEGIVNEVLERVRNLSMTLRPPMLDDLGLIPALLWHFDRYTAQTRVRVECHGAGVDQRFPPEIETAAFRIVQEALTNVARHAGVQSVTVQIWANQDRLGVRIQDEGVGFDPKAALAGASSGLAGMRERAHLSGGTLSIESAPGSGTSLLAELPLEPRTRAAEVLG